MPSSTIRRLRKLIEHQSSASAMGSMAEADAFANKVQQLMLSHDVTMSELGYDFKQWQEPFETDWSASPAADVNSSRRIAQWKEVFCDAVANEEWVYIRD